MKMKIAAIAACVAMSGSFAHAEGVATDPAVIAYQNLMKTFGGAAKVLGGMAGGKMDFDAMAAETAKTALVTGAAQIPAVFETQGDIDPASESKPEIWTNWDDFTAKAKALGDAAAALDATTLEGVQAGMGAVGGTCKACHTAYRL